MARNRSLLVKELSAKESNKKIQELLKERVILQAKYHLRPGNVLMTSYNAKFKENTYDMTPMVLILKRSPKYTLGLNFHWIPLSMRLNLIKTIITLNAPRIKQGKKILFNYSDLKPMMKSLGYAPCIRLYINSRMGRQGIVIPPERMIEVARLKAESFTKGRYSAAQLFQMAKARGRAKEKPKRKR